MKFLLIIGAAVAGLLHAALGRLFGDELKAWIPWFTERLVQIAVKRLPAELRERFDEEWRSHLNELPGELGKLFTALGLPFAAHGIVTSLRIDQRESIATRSLAQAFSRAVPICLSMVALLLVLPMFFLVTLSIALTSRGPVLLRQERLGRRGRVFNILKFRTFEGSQLTRVGSFIRLFRLDELPMLWNVLRGDMAFVGPRPIRPAVASALSSSIPSYSLRSLVRPGITGWAQISGACGSSLDDVKAELAHDLFYIKHGSFILDLAILFETTKCVLYGPPKRETERS